MIPYGMYILTTKSKEGQDVDAATVSWLTQTSFSPPLIAVGIKAGSKTHSYVKDTGVFAVNVISGDQINMAFTFFKTQERDGDSIGGESFELGRETGCPLLLNSPAWWECKEVGEVAQGDHTCSWARCWRPESAGKIRPSSCGTTTSTTEASLQSRPPTLPYQTMLGRCFGEIAGMDRSDQILLRPKRPLAALWDAGDCKERS